jgi:crossover junction endodeoxyribonuclease RuvC
MRILGIDPGSLATGYGVVDSEGGSLTHVASGTVRPRRSGSAAARLNEVYSAIDRVIRDHAPDVAVVEQVFVAQSARSALVLGQARGAALAAIGARGVAVNEYAATRIKRAVTGNGRAGKRQVQTMIRRLLTLQHSPAQDACDALAAAICHVHSHRLVSLGAAPRRRRRFSLRGARAPRVRRAP